MISDGWKRRNALCGAPTQKLVPSSACFFFLMLYGWRKWWGSEATALRTQRQRLGSPRRLPAAWEPLCAHIGMRHPQSAKP